MPIAAVFISGFNSLTFVKNQPRSVLIVGVAVETTKKSGLKKETTALSEFYPSKANPAFLILTILPLSHIPQRKLISSELNIFIGLWLKLIMKLI